MVLIIVIPLLYQIIILIKLYSLGLINFYLVGIVIDSNYPNASLYDYLYAHVPKVLPEPII